MLIQLSLQPAGCIESGKQRYGSFTTIEIDNRQREMLDLIIPTQSAKRTAEDNDENQGQQEELQHLAALFE